MKEKGFVMVLCLLMLMVVTLLGIAGMQTATFGTMISGNNLEGQKAFWIAESGLQDAKNRLDQAYNVDTFRDVVKELPSPVSYGEGTYTITTETDPYDPTRRVVVKSVGSTSGAKKIVEATFKKLPLPSLGPLYSKNLVTVSGDATIINGNDACGGENKPAITTTWETIDFKNGELYGNGNFTAVTEKSSLEDVKSVTETKSSQNYNLQEYINSYRSAATYVSADANIQGSAKVLSPAGEPTTINELWGSDEIKIQSGQPIQLMENAEPNAIYLNPPVNPGNGIKEVTLTGVGGHGLLLIDGSADISGGFNWYGLIIATGGIKFTGQGGDAKNITGEVMVGESGIVVDSRLSGSVAIRYCSAAKNHFSTVIMISWRVG